MFSCRAGGSEPNHLPLARNAWTLSFVQRTLVKTVMLCGLPKSRTRMRLPVMLQDHRRNPTYRLAVLSRRCATPRVLTLPSFWAKKSRVDRRHRGRQPARVNLVSHRWCAVAQEKFGRCCSFDL